MIFFWRSSFQLALPSSSLTVSFGSLLSLLRLRWRSDARRQDGVQVAKSLCYQLALRHRAFADAVLRLDPSSVASLQRADEALAALVAEPLRALPAGIPPPVVLFDALDEADPLGARTALSNPLVRLVTALHAAGALVVATTRPVPEHVPRALEGRWGAAAFLRRGVVDFLSVASPPSPAPEAAAAPQRRSAKGQEVMPEAWRAAIAANSGSKVFCTVATALHESSRTAAGGGPPAAPPQTLAQGYLAFFERNWPAEGSPAEAELRRLLQILMAAREPPSVAALEALGARRALSLLPGWGTLFQERCAARFSQPVGQGRKRAPSLRLL